MAEENRKETKGKESGMTVEEIAEKINSLDEERREYITKLLSEELKAEQLKHQLQRQANREESESKKQRKARAHILCFEGAHVESLFPAIKGSGKAEFVQFMQGLLEIPGVRDYGKNFLYRPIDGKEED